MTGSSGLPETIESPAAAEMTACMAAEAMIFFSSVKTGAPTRWNSLQVEL